MQQNPLYKHVGTEIRGCNGKVTVGQLPERLGRIIRPLLYQLCEEHTQWPLSFNEKTDELRLKTGQEELRKSLDGMWKDIYVSYGKCVPDKNGVSVMTPKILKRITKKSSQGKVYIAAYPVPVSQVAIVQPNQRIDNQTGIMCAKRTVNRQSKTRDSISPSLVGFENSDVEMEDLVLSSPIDKEYKSWISGSLGSRRDPSEILLAVKCNKIRKTDIQHLWINGPLSGSRKLLQGTRALYQIVSSSYIDALCYQIFSFDMENGLLPHFPVCYCSHLAKAKVKRENGAIGASLYVTPEGVSPPPKKEIKSDVNPLVGSLMIWLEYLPKSATYILDRKKEAKYWWSFFFQTIATLLYAQRKYGFSHGDFHSCNIRTRKVPSDTMLYYRDNKTNQLFVVPTYGYLYVIIDFGRSVINPWQGQATLNTQDTTVLPLCSSEYYTKGKVVGKICDNPSFDFARLCLGLTDLLPVIQDPVERSQVLAFIQKALVNQHDLDLIAESNKSLDDKQLFYIIDTLPRLICTSCDPELLISTPEMQMYRVESINGSPFLL